MKTIKIAFTFILLLAIGLFIFFKSPNIQEKKQVIQSKKRENSAIPDTILNTKEKPLKKVNDTTVVFYFKDLSDIYNYKLVDKFYTREVEHYHDSVVRYINIYSKSESLVQHINIGSIMHPWYFKDKDKLKISRSYITGKNAKVPVFDQYFGELVIADLNFDGLEDFSTVTDYGADNGSHHSFFIQQKNGLFKLNRYLTEEVTWFPEKFNDSLKTFTRIMAAGAWGIGYTTFKYDTIRNKWKIIKNYQIDLATGKVVK